MQLFMLPMGMISSSESELVWTLSFSFESGFGNLSIAQFALLSRYSLQIFSQNFSQDFSQDFSSDPSSNPSGNPSSNLNGVPEFVSIYT
jgi:hypothetical protein